MARKARGVNGTTGGIRKKAKDPNAPKRALSAYLLFSNDHRDELKEKNPDLKFGDVGKILGERWRNMNEEERQPYTLKAEEAKKVYDKQMTEYRSRQSANDLQHA